MYIFGLLFKYFKYHFPLNKAECGKVNNLM